MKKILSLMFIMFMSLGLLVACDGKIPGIGGSGKQLESVSNISYDGSVISWQTVSGAQKYSVSINSGDAISAPAGMFSYPNTAGTAFSVTIVAKADGYKDSEAVTKTFSPLGTVTNVRFSDDGTVSYDPVDNATYYFVNVDGKDNVVAGLTFDGLTVGKHIVKVCAKADSENASIAYYSKYSDPKTVNILGKTDEEKISFNALTGTLTWQAVTDAHSYEVRIQSGVDIIAETVTKTAYSFDPQNSDFTISVRAIGDHVSSFDSKETTEKKFVHLDAAKNVHLEDGILYWDEVQGADGYKLRINNSSIVTLTECKYEKLPINSSVDVEIMPTSKNTAYFASWSARQSYRILPAPVLQWKGDHDAFDGNKISSVIWDAVENARGYDVSVSFMGPNDKEPSLPEITTLGSLVVGFEHDYLNVGTYFIKVKTLSDDADPNTSDSKYSAEIKVIRLPAPALTENAISSNADDLQSGVTVSFNPVTRATGYRVRKQNNNYQTISNNQFKDYNVVASDVIVEQLVNYKIQSIGKNAATENGVITAVLDSLTDSMLSVDIKVLATPTVNDMNGYVYSYASVYGAFGYNVSVGGKNNGRDNESIDLSYLSAGTFDVKVCARGNGKDVLASNYSPSLQIYRLMAPYDIAVRTDSENEGTLSYSSDPNTAGSGFEIYIDGSDKAVPVDNLTNMKQYITTTGTEMFMRATANRYNELKTVYYMTSPASETLHIRKLATVTFGDHAFTNDQFIWNASAEAVRYEVYNAQDILYASFDGASMQLDSFEGGKNYTLKVKAIGNGKTTFNSDFSDQKTIYKLKTPTIRLEDGMYKWNAVADATSYALYIDGEIASLDIHVAGEEFSVTPNFRQLKSYSIQLKAVGDGGVRTIDSAFYEFTQETKQLQTPDFKIGYTKDSFEKDGEITATITKETPYANGYTYIFGGVSVTSKELSANYNPNGAGKYRVGVYAVGGLFDENGVYYLPSQTCGNNDAYTITLLGSVDESNIKVSMDGRITWNSVTDAISYTLKLTINGESYELSDLTSPAYDLSDIIAYKNVTSLTVEIQAHGNSKCVSSAFTRKEWPVITH